VRAAHRLASGREAREEAEVEGSASSNWVQARLGKREPALPALLLGEVVAGQHELSAELVTIMDGSEPERLITLSYANDEASRHKCRVTTRVAHKS
jgi:hypothetical protein